MLVLASPANHWRSMRLTSADWRLLFSLITILRRARVNWIVNFVQGLPLMSNARFLSWVRIASLMLWKPRSVLRTLKMLWNSLHSINSPPPPGGGGALDFHVDGGGGTAGGRKPDPVAMRSVHKKYTLSQYNLLKNCICIPCRNIAPSLVLRSRACHKHCGLGTPGKQPCDKRSSPPVAN